MCGYNSDDGGESHYYCKSPLHIQAVSPLPEFTPLPLAFPSLGPSMHCGQGNTPSPGRWLLLALTVGDSLSWTIREREFKNPLGKLARLKSKFVWPDLMQAMEFLKMCVWGEDEGYEGGGGAVNTPALICEGDLSLERGGRRFTLASFPRMATHRICGHRSEWPH